MTGLQNLTADLETLLKMREWLSDPAHWCRFWLVTERGATCLAGAYHRAQPAHKGVLGSEEFYKEAAGLLGFATGYELVNFNDFAEHADVLKFLDDAISARVC